VSFSPNPVRIRNNEKKNECQIHPKARTSATPKTRIRTELQPKRSTSAEVQNEQKIKMNVKFIPTLAPQLRWYIPISKNRSEQGSKMDLVDVVR
jgi:hypothetical protein